MPPSVRDLIAAYLRHSVAIGLHCPEALHERQTTLGWFCDLHGDTGAEDMKAFHLSDWVDSQERWKSISTRRNKANHVRAAFQWAFETERISRNPFARVRYAEAERKPDMPEETIDFVAHAGNKPFERIVRWLRLTGCRLSEACRATWDQIDWDRGVWIVPRHKSRKHTKRAKEIVLVEEAVELLRSIALAEAVFAPTHDMVVAVSPQGMVANADFIFPNNRGHPYCREVLAQQLRRLKKKYGITSAATLHGIRHAAASAAIGAGGSVKLIAEQLGHSSSVITEKYYFHRSDSMIGSIREAFGRGITKRTVDSPASECSPR